MATHESGAITLTPGSVLGLTGPVMGGAAQTIDGEHRSWPRHPDDVPLSMWDSGVFVTELINLHLNPKRLVLSPEEQKKAEANPEMLLNVVNPPEPIAEGTYRGTQLALTKMYELLETK